MPLPGMDQPPLPSPDVQTQMGMPQKPPSVGGLATLAQRNTAPGPQGAALGAPNPHGFLLAQVDAIKKVLEQIAGTEPLFAPFAQKAQQIIDTGVSAVSTAPTGGQSPGRGPAEAGTAGPPPPPPGTGGGVPPLG